MLSMTSFNTITVPKNLYWKESNTELRLEEYLKHSYMRTMDYKNNHLYIKNLSENQILEATKEFICRLESRQIFDPNDDLNQELFLSKLRNQAYFREQHGFIHPKFKIGSDWLKSKDLDFFN